jgi:hypothetical protein
VKEGFSDKEIEQIRQRTRQPFADSGDAKHR